MSRTRIITSWCDVGSVSDSSGWDVVQRVWLRYWIMAWLEPPILYHMGRARKLRLIWNPLFFRLSEVHNGMDRLKPSPAGQMNRRSRSRDRDNWGKMRLERGRCKGFPCFSMSICLIRYILEASGKPTKINKSMAFEKETLALPRIIQPPRNREWIYWKVRSRPSWQPSEDGQLCAESVRSEVSCMKEYCWVCGRSAGRHWIWIWDTINVMSLKNLKNRSERGGFHRRTTRRQRFASRWLKVGRETLTPSSWICPFEGVCSAESLECTAHHWNKEQLTPENPGV